MKMSKSNEIFMKVLVEKKAARVDGTEAELTSVQEGVLHAARKNALLLGSRRVVTWRQDGSLYIDLVDGEIDENTKH